jgi:hypothetical protein
MKNSKKQSRSTLSIRTIKSKSTTPQSSAHPSAYPSENEEHKEVLKPFKFFELPSELRNKIYDLHFCGAPSIIDLDPDNFKTIHRQFPLLFVSKQMHEEASHYFYSTRTIRIFPTHPGRFFKTKRPLLVRLPGRYRACLTSLQLRLGPGFSNPPRGWVVNDALGLKDATSVRVLKVFVEVDTSNPIFKGFRNAVDGFYEKFSSKLLDQILISVPSIFEVQFDAYPSVGREGEMMTGLIDVARRHKKLISWGPERGWNEENDDSWDGDGLVAAKSLRMPIRELTVAS